MAKQAKLHLLYLLWLLWLVSTLTMPHGDAGGARAQRQEEEEEEGRLRGGVSLAFYPARLLQRTSSPSYHPSILTRYFILLNSKHLVHFQPTTGFVDPFKKTISGKARRLLITTPSE